MDQYSLEDEVPFPRKAPLLYPESQALTCSDAVSGTWGLARDLLYGGLRGLELDPNFPAPDASSEAAGGQPGHPVPVLREGQ